MVKKPSLVSNIYWNLATFVVSVLVMFIMTPVVLGALGSHHYGIWSLILTISSYLELMDLGMRTALTRSVAESSGKGEVGMMSEIMSTMLLYFAFVGLCIMAIGVIGVNFLGTLFKIAPVDLGLAKQAFLLFTLIVGLKFPMNAVTGILVGLQRYDVTNRVYLGMIVIRNILIWLCLTHGFGLIAVVFLHAGLDLMSMAINTVQAFFIVPGLKFRLKLASLQLFKRFAKIGGKVLCIGICLRFVDSIGPILVGMLISVEQVTYFGLAYSFVRYIGGFINAGIRVVVPYIGEMHGAHATHGDLQQKVFDAAYVTCQMTLLFTATCCGGIALVGREFMGLWVGPDVAVRVMPILYPAMLYALAAQMSTGQLHVMIGMGRLGRLPIVYFVEIALNLGLSVVLGPRYGAIGVAAGGMAATAVVRVTGSFFSMRSATNRQTSWLMLRHNLMGLALLFLVYGVFHYLKSVVSLHSYVSIAGYAFVFSGTYLGLGMLLFFRPFVAQVFKRKWLAGLLR